MARMTKRSCRWIAAATLLLSLMMIGWAGRAFVAEFLMIGPRALVSAWTAGEAEPAVVDIDKAIALVETAVALKTDDADMHLELGRLLKLRALAFGYGTQPRTVALQRAAAEFQAAMQRRPSWAVAWAAYAQAQYLLGRKGHGSLQAYRRAMQLAPHEAESYRLLAWLGFAHWPLLSNEDREAFRALLDDFAAPAYAPPLLEYAVQFHQEQLVAPLAEADPRLEAQLKALLQKRLEATKHRAH